MDVCFSSQEMMFDLKFDKVCTILGDNENSKIDILNVLKEGFEGTLGSNFMVDNINVSKNEYEVLYFTDEQDFDSVFKFTKTNLYRKCLYQQVFTDELRTKFKTLVDSLNEDIKDIDKELDSCFHSTIHFKTQLDSIEDFISENTMVCLNDQPIKLSGKYYKKMLLFQLLSFYINHSEREKIVVCIDDIDSYFSESSLLVVCQMILELVKGREVYFIITGTSPFLYTFFYNLDCCYKIKGKKLYQIGDLDQLAREVFLRNQYYVEQVDYIVPLDEYLEENLHYITADDVEFILSNYFVPNIDRVGRIFCNDQILIANPLLSKNLVGVPLLPYTNFYERELFSVICDHLGIDKTIQ